MKTCYNSLRVSQLVTVSSSFFPNMLNNFRDFSTCFNELLGLAKTFQASSILNSKLKSFQDYRQISCFFSLFSRCSRLSFIFFYLIFFRRPFSVKQLEPFTSYKNWTLKNLIFRIYYVHISKFTFTFFDDNVGYIIFVDFILRARRFIRRYVDLRSCFLRLNGFDPQRGDFQRTLFRSTSFPFRIRGWGGSGSLFNTLSQGCFVSVIAAVIVIWILIPKIVIAFGRLGLFAPVLIQKLWPLVSIAIFIKSNSIN